METIINGKSVTFVSGLKTEILQKLKKYSPKTLKLLDEGKNEIFSVQSGKFGEISDFGITFNSTDSYGYAYVTMPIPSSVAEETRAAWVTDFMYSFAKSYQELESKILSANEELTHTMDALATNITVSR